MRFNRSVAAAISAAVISCLVCVCTAQAQAASPGRGGSKPAASVFFPKKAFEFEPVIEGVKVVHDFDVVNKGLVPLLINDVRTG
jgi:hypothetical protein